MAEAALKKLEDQLNCPVCLDTFTDPKQLQCNHIYCRQCLRRLVDRDQQGQLILTCPNCRQVTPVPANGVAGLQPAFHINNLLELQASLKIVSPDDLEEAASDTASSLPNNPSQTQKAAFCSEHQDKELELYCESCEELICLKCALKSSIHHTHNYSDVPEAFKKFKDTITPSLEPMEKQLLATKEALTLIDTRCGEISDQRAATEANIQSTFRRLHEILDARQTQLIDQLHHATQRKLKSLAAQRDQIETLLAHLSSCLDCVKESLKTECEREVMAIKKSLEQQVRDLTTSFRPDSLRPATEADMVFTASDDLISACQTHGQVALTSEPDPLQCYATGKGIEEATIGETSTIMLHIVNCMSQPCKVEPESLECELVSDITAVRNRCSVERQGESQYEVSYRPNKGRQKLHVKVQGKHIGGSPFNITVHLSECTGTPSRSISVETPWGVAINHSGGLVVTEYSKHRISVFSASGELLHSFGEYGSREGQLDYPRGVAVDHEGNILVADTYNHRVQKFTHDGQFLAAAGTKGSSPLQFSYPKNLTFNASNKKLYISDENNRIQILNSNLSFSSTFGKEGDTKGHFNRPNGLACDSSGNVYVVDVENQRVQVFTAKGKFLRMFGKYGEGRGELNMPVCVAVDRSGVVYVSEDKNYRVSSFTTHGRFVSSMGKLGDGPGAFRSARGVAVDGNGVVYVCDKGNNCVQIFK